MYGMAHGWRETNLFILAIADWTGQIRWGHRKAVSGLDIRDVRGLWGAWGESLLNPGAHLTSRNQIKSNKCLLFQVNAKKSGRSLNLLPPQNAEWCICLHEVAVCFRTGMQSSASRDTRFSEVSLQDIAIIPGDLSPSFLSAWLVWLTWPVQFHQALTVWDSNSTVM